MSSVNGRRGESGSITVLFVLFVVFLVGAISYALYAGQQIEKKIALQNAADTAVIAMANHSGQGLNMIAANNLAIGASIHVAGAVPILAAYVSVGWVFSATGAKALEEAAKLVVEKSTAANIELKNEFQDRIWNPLAPIPGFFMKIASGLTRYNDFLKDWWLTPAGISGMEMNRMNLPGSLALPFQKVRVPVPVYMKYEGIGKSSPRSTVCQAVKASAALGGASGGRMEKVEALRARDNFLTWLAGPYKSLAREDGLTQFLSHFEKIMNAARALMPIEIGFVDCGYGLKTSLFALLDAVADPDAGVGKGMTLVDPHTIVSRLGANLGGIVMDVISSALPGAPKGEERNILGQVTRAAETASPAYLAWKAIGSTGVAAHAGALLRAPGAGARFAKAAILWAGVNKMKEQSETFYCEQDGQKVKRAVPIVEGDATVCLSLNSINANCAMKDFVQDFTGLFDSVPVLSAITNKIDDFVTKECVAYDRFAIDASDSEKVADYRIHGISVADWGKQAEAYGYDHYRAKLKAIFSGVVPGGVSGRSITARQETLGFLFPLNEREFGDSNTFYLLSANALRNKAELPQHLCPVGYEITDVSGKKRCGTVPLLAFAELQNGDNALTGGMAKLSTGAAVAGDAAAGALSGVWSRVQWVSAGARVQFLGKDPEPAGMRSQLFWPAWRTLLTPVDAGDLAGLLRAVIPTGDSSGSEVSSLKAE